MFKFLSYYFVLTRVHYFLSIYKYFQTYQKYKARLKQAQNQNYVTFALIDRNDKFM